MKITTKTNTNGDPSGKADVTIKESDSNAMRKSRRRLMQVLVAGGAVVTAKSVPNSWSRPVINAVTLPAHARTSGELIRLGNSNINELNTQNLMPGEALLAAANEQVFSKIFDTLVEQAIADDAWPGVCNPLTGCVYIEYQSGENNGKLYLSGDNIREDAAPSNLMFDFTNGEDILFNNSCLGTNTGFRITLVDDDSATFELFTDPIRFGPFTLYSDFIECPPITEDF